MFADIYIYIYMALKNNSLRKSYHQQQTTEMTINNGKVQSSVSSNKCDNNDMSERNTTKKKTKKIHDVSSINEKENNKNVNTTSPSLPATAPFANDKKNECKLCGKIVFQVEQMKAEKFIWHRNCFRCSECNKQISIDTYESHDGSLYCKPHFKALFVPKIADMNASQKMQKPELIIRENEPMELPADVVRGSLKSDLGLDELQNINVKQKFHIFERSQKLMVNGDTVDNTLVDTIINDSNNKIHPQQRSPSILLKLARFQSQNGAKNTTIGISNKEMIGCDGDEFNTSSSTSEMDDYDDDGENDDEDPNNERDIILQRAKKVQKEKPFHFTGMRDVKKKWELAGNDSEQHAKDERREERKQELQTIRSRLFLGKQVKMKEAYQQAVLESEVINKNNGKDSTIVPGSTADTRVLKQKFENGECVFNGNHKKHSLKDDEMEVFESDISKNSRSIFLQMDANYAASRDQHMLASIDFSKTVNNKLPSFREERSKSPMFDASEVVKSSSHITIADDIEEVVPTADIQQRFKFFETYKEKEKPRNSSSITPPLSTCDIKQRIKNTEHQFTVDNITVKDDTVNSSESDSLIAEGAHTTTKMLSKFRQMEEDLAKNSQIPYGVYKPLKQFTPPPSEFGGNAGDVTSEEEDNHPDFSDDNEIFSSVAQRQLELDEAQKAAKAKQLKAKFEHWEESSNQLECNATIHSNTNNHKCNGDEETPQVETTKTLKARFESIKENSGKQVVSSQSRVKVNRFV